MKRYFFPSTRYVASVATLVTALAGCNALPVGAEAPTAENIASRILAICAYSVPIVEIAALLKANGPTLQTASDIAAVICQTAANVVATGSPAAPTTRGLLAVPTVQPPLAISVNGVTLHMKPL